MRYKVALLGLALALCLTGCHGGRVNAPVASETGTPITTEPTYTEPTVSQTDGTEPVSTEPSTPAPTEPDPTDPPPTEPAPTDPLPVITEITMTFVGDCTFGTNQKATYWNSFNQYYDENGPEYFFDGVRDIFESDDITVINLEGSLTTSDDLQQKLWNHKGDPKYVEIMTNSSVEVATMGNNHRLDYGQSGCDETMQVLDEAGIAWCFDDNYLIYEVKGVKVGFVSVNEVYDGWTVDGWLEKGYEYLRSEGCAIVVACIHWGGQKTPVLEERQYYLGEKCIDLGYDLVVGNHPHVLQAMQMYKGRLICYSLGNFCYGGSKNPADKDSGIFQQTFTLVDGALLPVLDAQFIPCYLSSVMDHNDYQPTLALGEEYQRIIDKMNSYGAEFGFVLDDDGRPVIEPVESEE